MKKEVRDFLNSLPIERKRAIKKLLELFPGEIEFVKEVVKKKEKSS